ncbi:hypothetical protein HDZ31DRAFT_66730 [Schizophyllum fasciatum]
MSDRHQIITVPCLQSVRTLKSNLHKFNLCFISLVETLGQAYVHGRIVHGDVSEDSAMWYTQPSGDAVAILIDWDLADIQHPDCAQRGTYRCGTGLFMAIRLQRYAGIMRHHPEHRHHHDLESLFWLLVYCMVRFSRGNSCQPCIPEWQEGDWCEAAEHKAHFLYNMDAFNDVIDLILPPYTDAVNDWIYPLSELFMEAHHVAFVRILGPGRKRKAYFDEEVYAKKVTLEAFMQAIGRVTST